MEEEGKTSMAIPEELVERILAMVPFPYLFKARALSKSWQARFEPISSQDDEEKKRLAFSFQKHVVQLSSKWKTFSPIFISREDFISYDRQSQEWRKSPSLSFLPSECFGSSNWRIEGALLLVVGYPEMNVRTSMEFFVANILTRRWKKLPSPMREFEFCTNLLIPMKSMYKVIVFKDDHMAANCVACAAQIYDSHSGAWSSVKKFSLSERFGHPVLSDWANFNGGLYRVVSLGSDINLGPPIMRRMMGQPSEMTWGLLSFNVNEGTFEIVQMGQTDLPLDDGNVGLAVCNGSLLMLVYDMFGSHPNAANGLTVLKIDLERRRWLEMTRRTFVPGKFFQKPASDGNCIFFVGERVASGVLAYNVQENEWSHFPCPLETQQQWAENEWSHFPCPLEVQQWAFEATRRTYYKVYNAPTGRYQWEPVSFQPSLNPFGEV